ncbi:DUF6114 domain-containing protein [Sphaerisporangium corydalis]|uniref:DUF6114 domain-containing protein n=1 Tax=Sphaerisporangium corydalis TaxID=1441875 RepID=A0ABV9EGK4_9ACTN|nr:DUF6114 domain-containing protein [Sphaerisporangium corydalis]
MKSWRRSRPFWGGLLTLLAGVEMLSVPFGLDVLPLLLHSAQAGLTYLISITLIVLGPLIWAYPAQRVFLGVVVVLLSILSVLYVNLGGFVAGLVLGLLGGALSAAWTPSGTPAGEPGTIGYDEPRSLRNDPEPEKVHHGS